MEKLKVQLTKGQLFDFLLYHTFSKGSGFLVNMLGMCVIILGAVMQFVGKIEFRQFVLYVIVGVVVLAYTPLQLANYIATLVSGGEFCQPHLLKAVKTYDNTEVVTVGETKPERVVSISDSTLDAVKRGMLGYTQPGGSVYNAFRNCVVTAGAKTGTSQLGGDQTENGVFVCFAPYDDPEIAVAIVIEHATWGANVASTGVEILNAYFSADTNTSSVTGENQLLP